MRQEIPRILDEMQEGAQRIKRIVNDLKDFARRDDLADKVLLDMNRVVQTALRLVEPTIRKATHHLQCDYAERLPAVRGNDQRIEQVVVNLILNACQALPDAEHGISITTRYNHATSSVLLIVRDEGVGIAAEHLSRLTDPFFTTKRESGGTGLGLSVSDGNRQGAWRTADLRLKPRYGYHRDPGDSRGPRGADDMNQQAYTGIGILLVDDEPAWLNALSLTLKSCAGLTNITTCQDSRQVMGLLDQGGHRPGAAGSDHCPIWRAKSCSNRLASSIPR